MTFKYSFYLIMLYAGFAVCSPSWGALTNTNIQNACSYLDDSGLGTRGWQRSGDSNFYASSPYKEIGPGSSQSNYSAYIAYYIDGNVNKAEKLTLVLNVNNKAAVEAAHAELLKAAGVLARKALGAELPAVISQAIVQGRSAQAKVGNTSIELIRSDWSTDMGYNLMLIFK